MVDTFQDLPGDKILKKKKKVPRLRGTESLLREMGMLAFLRNRVLLLVYTDT